MFRDDCNLYYRRIIVISTIGCNWPANVRRWLYVVGFGNGCNEKMIPNSLNSTAVEAARGALRSGTDSDGTEGSELLGIVCYG